MVITSDSGLCGGFNANVIRNFVNTVNERHANSEYGIVAIGNYGAEFFRKNGYNVIDSLEIYQMSQVSHRLKRLLIR